MLAPEDDLELLDQEIRQARSRRDSIARAPFEGRWARDAIAHEDALGAAEARIRVLEEQRDGLARAAQ